MLCLTNSTTNTSAAVGCRLGVLTTDQQRLLQPLWDLRKGHEEFLASPLFTFVLSVLAYFGYCLPFTLMDLYCGRSQWYLRYKIHPERQVTKAQVLDALTLTFWNHLLLILPATMAQWVWMPPTPLPELAPTLWEFVWQQAAGLLIFDFQYFVWHITHHKVPFLYRTIHSVHHRYHSPFALVTQYFHPWEVITTGFLTVTNTWFFHCHALTNWSYLVVSIVLSIDIHTGMDFPMSPHHLIPCLFGGPPKHDMHHSKPLTNFAPFFNHWDRLLGSFYPPVYGGGLKSKALLDWESRHKECKKQL